MKTKVSDLRKHYADMAEADRDYPPLRFKSLKGKVNAAEWQARVDCACAYRLVRIFRMDDSSTTTSRFRIRAPVPAQPMGLMYDEICTSSLLKVDLEGKVLWGRLAGASSTPSGTRVRHPWRGAPGKPELHC
jgi:hypothetical protein